MLREFCIHIFFAGGGGRERFDRRIKDSPYLSFFFKL